MRYAFAFVLLLASCASSGADEDPFIKLERQEYLACTSACMRVLKGHDHAGRKEVWIQGMPPVHFCYAVRCKKPSRRMSVIPGPALDTSPSDMSSSTSR